MAIYRSKDRAEIVSFCRSLEGRGYHQVQSTSRLVQPRLNEFRVYPCRKWWHVSYQEPALDGPIKDIPDPLDPAKPWDYGGRGLSSKARCSCGCGGSVEVRGLSRACYTRWRYWNIQGVRDTSIDRARANREARRVAQETAQKDRT